MVGSVLQKSQKRQELSFYENRLIDFCREDLHIPEQQLYENSDGDSTSGEGIPSLRDALSDLAKICFDLAARVEDQVIRLAPMASQETYRRYKEFQKNYGHLEQDLQCRELLLCSGRNLISAIRIDLTDWYQHVDDEQLMRMKNPMDMGEISSQGRAKVRVNRKLNADKERALPQNFDFSWLRGGLEDYQSAKYNTLRDQLLHIFKQYSSSCGTEIFATRDQLQEIVRNVLVLSFLHPFLIEEDDESVDLRNYSELTLAPVVSYLIFLIVVIKLARES